jgi:hypothetical protein
MSEGAPPGPTQCLTEEEVALVGRVDPSEVPEPLALHLASCPRCQERALFGSEPRRRRRPGSTAALPTLKRALALLALLVLAMLVFFFTLGQLTGEP